MNSLRCSWSCYEGHLQQTLRHVAPTGSCGNVLFVRPFSEEEERRDHSTKRELLAVLEAYTSKRVGLCKKNLVHVTDNAAVEHILLKGSPKQELQAIALAIYEACLQEI